MKNSLLRVVVGVKPVGSSSSWLVAIAPVTPSAFANGSHMVPLLPPHPPSSQSLLCLLFGVITSFVKQMMRRIALEKELLRQPSLCGLLSSIRPLPLFFRHQSYRNDNGNFGRNSDNSFESSDDFERRLFGDVNNDKISDSFYRKLDKLEKAHGRSGTGSKLNSDDSRIIDGISDSFNSLSDGMDEKLKEAARTFVFSDEIHDENYKFRPDVTFYPGMTYTTRDLDLTKPGVQKRFKRNVFETTTQEVLKKADFRNVRFLSNFLTEAGIIIKRSQTRISAKAQRKVAREIKTARVFGLMPFTSMGRKPFIFGRSMKDEAEDFGYEDNTASAATDPLGES
ncbi:hypothetical protein OPV22_006144 [Ensete ventricosum]|uniref:Small ribosomal subunit protein bS18c n=1 Tax=Ensete ventricosum TaxID=4639 RepID=A0AAV8RSF8_ENSVE|nr:hypothetical protein OPV22_006144 [Ensete ventricosum]